MARRIEYVGPPVIAPAEVAEHSRIDPADLQAAMLEHVIIPGVTAQAESKTGAAIRLALYEEEWPEHYGSGRPLDVGQAGDIQSIAYIGADGGMVEFDPLPPHRLEVGQRESFLHFLQGRPAGRLVIRYLAGADLSVCGGVKQWLLMQAGTAHQYRETMVSGRVLHELSASFLDALLADITLPPRF